jgi:DNA-binding transcriptional ArsR family regulator
VQDDVRTRLDQIEQRLARLERVKPDIARARGPVRDSEAAMVFLDALSRRAGKRYHRGAVAGALGYAGYLQVDDRRYAWSREFPVPGLLDLDHAAVARWLGAITSPQRVTLLLELFGRDRTSSDLASALGEASTGQVYHHLKELQANGLVIQVRRGVYRVAPHLLIPVMIILAAAGEGLQGRTTDEPEPFPAGAASVERSS